VAAVYFRPRTLWDTIGLENMELNSTAYCSFSDISQGHSAHWSGSVSDLLEHELLGPLFHEVSISGPVFFKDSVKNPDLLNLYFSFPKQDGTYRRITVELIISYASYGDTSAPYSAFVNIDNTGYFVTSGKAIIHRLCNNILIEE